MEYSIIIAGQSGKSLSAVGGQKKKYYCAEYGLSVERGR
jgi:hypothetical protein